MKIFPTIGTFLAAAALAFAAGSRVGGPYDIEYESLNSGGISYASNGVIKLGGSLGQSGLIYIRTNAPNSIVSQDGFWKAETPCEMYPADLQEIRYATNSIAITFHAMLSNTYSVAYLNLEGGGLTNGLHIWTNIVAGPLVGQGGVGSVTTIFVNASAVTNAGRFFLIRCQSP